MFAIALMLTFGVGLGENTYFRRLGIRHCIPQPGRKGRKAATSDPRGKTAQSVTNNRLAQVYLRSGYQRRLCCPAVV